MKDAFISDNQGLEKLMNRDTSSNQSHQITLGNLRGYAVLLENSLDHIPEEVEKTFIENFAFRFTYLSLQLFYKFEVQAIRITGMVECLTQGPPPEIETCLRLQLAQAHLLLDDIDHASIDQLEWEEVAVISIWEDYWSQMEKSTWKSMKVENLLKAVDEVRIGIAFLEDDLCSSTDENMSIFSSCEE
ncbi:uncharacterized protein MELLADRAFT_103737 [Melampsora larici-populina 98AG31]|uniref:Uncharacterized protein n=1 Tax=Melampsora larici-populina (strain 98AG31 / pathotype 3-4-7) TaxID=747676 RepID=F4RC76_MELLP|nr:uncharacterized protein MELLADRAFT_103737 [Melampsora larici-populina 98AG31]EGG09998.1 hypothetical protein MELLADRAFT_103737 [Melampsora larici-populina 98AG31]